MKRNPSNSWSIVAGGGVILLLLTAASVSAQTLQNRWSFNNHGVATSSGGGGTVADSVGGQTATLEGDAYFDGITNVVLDGTAGTYVSLPGGLLTGLQAASFEGWVNSDALPDNVHLFEFSDGSGTGVAYARYVVHAPASSIANNQNAFELADFASTTGDPNQLLASGVGFGGVPLHVICTYDPVAGVQAIYTNGLLEAMRTFPSNQTPLSSVSPTEASLGQSPWFNYGDPYLSGSITEFRVWSAALNPLQVAALDAAGAGAVSTNYGTVTNLQLEVAFQMTQHALQQVVVSATAS